MADKPSRWEMLFRADLVYSWAWPVVEYIRTHWLVIVPTGAAAVAVILSWIDKQSSATIFLMGVYAAVGGLLLVLVGLHLYQKIRGIKRQLGQQQGGAQALAEAPSKGILTQVDKIYYELDTRLTEEIATPIRARINELPTTAEREDYFVKMMTVGFIYFQFEEAWFYIFGSQLQALQRLNTASLRRVELFPTYASATEADPEWYADYSFDRWIGYMRRYGLIREDDDMVSITVRGRDFLKYLIGDGKPIHKKLL